MVSWIRGEPKLIPIKQKKHSSQTSHSMNFFNLFKMQFYLFIFGELYLSEPRFVCIAMRAGVTNRFGCYCRPNENKSWNTAFTFRTDTGLRSGLLADLVWLAGWLCIGSVSCTNLCEFCNLNSAGHSVVLSLSGAVLNDMESGCNSGQPPTLPCSYIIYAINSRIAIIRLTYNSNIHFYYFQFTDHYHIDIHNWQCVFVISTATLSLSIYPHI